jgi:hypothetical protein
MWTNWTAVVYLLWKWQIKWSVLIYAGRCDGRKNKRIKLWNMIFVIAWATSLVKQAIFLYKIKWGSKFTDNQGITVTDILICIIVSIFVPLCIYSKKIKKLEKKKAQKGASFGLAYLMPDCWLEVSFYPEGPATVQRDQGFPWFSLVPEQMLSWYPNSKLHCMLLMQLSQW